MEFGFYYGRPLYFCPVVSSSIFFFSLPNLSSWILDVCHTSTQCEFRMQVWNVQYAARWNYRMQIWRKKSPSRHHFTTLSGDIFATKARVDNRKKDLLNSNSSSTCPCNMVNFGPVMAEISSGVWGSPANFIGFHVLAALLHGTLVVGVSQTLQRWTEGATCIWQGVHHIGHWPSF